MVRGHQTTRLPGLTPTEPEARPDAGPPVGKPCELASDESRYRAASGSVANNFILAAASPGAARRDTQLFKTLCPGRRSVGSLAEFPRFWVGDVLASRFGSLAIPENARIAPEAFGHGRGFRIGLRDVSPEFPVAGMGPASVVGTAKLHFALASGVTGGASENG